MIAHDEILMTILDRLKAAYKEPDVEKRRSCDLFFTRGAGKSSFAASKWQGGWEMHPNEEKDAYFEALYRRFYETLRFLCMRYVGYDPRYMDAVDDCVQETFLAGYQHYEELLKHPNVGGWLTRTCMFRMGTVIRARKRDAHRTCNLEDVACADIRNGVQEWVDQEGAASAAKDLLSALSQTDRKLAYERYVCEDSMSKIAKKRGITESGAKVALYRVRQRARDYARKHPEMF